MRERLESRESEQLGKWQTEEQLKKSGKFSASQVKSIVSYCKKFPESLVRLCWRTHMQQNHILVDYKNEHMEQKCTHGLAAQRFPGFVTTLRADPGAITTRSTSTMSSLTIKWSTHELTWLESWKRQSWRLYMTSMEKHLYAYHACLKIYRTDQHKSMYGFDIFWPISYHSDQPILSRTKGLTSLRLLCQRIWLPFQSLTQSQRLWDPRTGLHILPMHV